MHHASHSLKIVNRPSPCRHADVPWDPGGAADLAAAVARALGQEGAAAAALLPALPPPAAELEALGGRSAAADAAAGEALAGEWFALLPALAAAAPGPSLASALLQARRQRNAKSYIQG